MVIVAVIRESNRRPEVTPLTKCLPRIFYARVGVTFPTTAIFVLSATRGNEPTELTMTTHPEATAVQAGRVLVVAHGTESIASLTRGEPC